MVNVTIYSIHGSYGDAQAAQQFNRIPRKIGSDYLRSYIHILLRFLWLGLRKKPATGIEKKRSMGRFKRELRGNPLTLRIWG
jgi:hypothetical protein